MDLTTKRSEDGNRRAPAAQRTASRGVSVAVASFFLLAVGGCGALDSLLEVELPGQVVEADLDNPVLAPTLVLGGVGSFECALARQAAWIGLWTHEVTLTTTSRSWVVMSTRNGLVNEYLGSCDGGTPVWMPFQVARVLSDDAIERIDGWVAEGIDIPDSEYLVARAHLYAAYSILFLSETHCAVAFDGGPRESREDGFRRAEARFGEAMAGAGTSAHASAGEILNAALVGRARARLNLGDDAGVMADASQVAQGFVLNATYDSSPSRRENTVFDHFLGTNTSVPMDFPLPIEVQGVRDPRIPLVDVGKLGIDATTPLFEQLKYPRVDSPIPIATWRDAQLMIAEVQGGQTAVAIINELRATVDDLPWVPSNDPSLPLPQFSSSDPAAIKAQVEEERKREFWLQGTRIGDLLRWGTPFVQGLDQRGRPYADNTCVPIGDAEVLANDNF